MRGPACLILLFQLAIDFILSATQATEGEKDNCSYVRYK